MKILTASLVLLFGTASLLISGDETPAKKDAARELAGWGTVTDPDSDCEFFRSDDALLISVPGAKPHDLAAEVETVNAPRVLQNVNGDFTIQVRVDGRFSPGAESTIEGRTGYNAGAIIAMTDVNNVVTLARAVLQQEDEEAHGYANFEIRQDGELVRMGEIGDHPLPKDGPVYLRLERRGDKFLGAVSEDGATWEELEAKEVPDGWPKEMQAGLAAISTSQEEFNPKFSKFQVVK